ncbi:peptidase family M28 [Colletotrichum tofieldiae]|nr:peptidase family M28 [Colletotrichum tofieldiae]
MTLSLFFLVFWTISKGASAVRPSALQRGYAHIWLFVLSWAILVVVTAAADRFKIASGYPFAFFHSAVFVSTLISLCDLFALPSKKEFAQHAHDDQETRDNISEVPNSDALISHHPHEEDHAAEEATETTPLRSGGNKEEEQQPYEKEQQWSAKLPSWTWFFQLLLLAPISIIVFLQIALFIVSAINSAAADGNDPLLVYTAIAAFSIIVLLPVTPFIHRASFYLPLFLLLIFFVTLIYNLVAFPFSAENRLKVRFQQTLDLDQKTSIVSITGLEKYTRKMIAELPSGAGQPVNCTHGAGLSSECHYNGADVMPKLPQVASTLSADLSKDKYANLVTVNISRSNSSSKLEFCIDAIESKSCTLTFDAPVSFNVHGSAG